MVILETTIFFDGTKLIEKLYPAGKSGEFLEEAKRDSLVQAIGTLAHDRFDDEIHSAKIGTYQISMISREIMHPGDETIKKAIYMYSISDLNTDNDLLIKNMNTAMDQFLNRYSRNDIFEKNVEKFKPFAKRFDKIFEGLIYSMTDRLK